ncbi:TMV resistance protein N-like isoform X2 [Lycium barbarum]|uniref:TMV resistance protein N-like isoform X2 n=1 Tax=Lycium barbarum TaxID=112863 RepID=UPI00293F664F|nr:TMV resistance protein N-like isoform X2 [Lycium barbarum]
MDSRFTQGQSSTSSNARFTQGVLSTPYDTTFSDTEGESSPSYYTPGESFTFSDTKGESSPSYDTPGKSFTFSNTEGESSTSSKFFYHVFLSFSGEDTRKKFVGHLENRLCQVGFQIFKDDKSVRKGDVISMALEKGIENSRISIVVLSTNYASSRWCLDELVKILECKEKLKQKVMPIFYDVEPSEVRKQTGKFGEGFAKLKEQFGDQSMEKWKAALTEVANISGRELRIVANGCESEFIEFIIQDVETEVSQTPLDVASHPVGVDSRAKVIESILRNGQCEDEARMVGIHGVGGIGKTTLAKELYNRLSQRVNFDGSFFLSNVRSEEKNHPHKLQKKILKKLLKTKDVKVDNVDDGITKIRTRLRSKKVLLVLDDVDHIDQLKYLARERSWFGSGSIVIITTRDKRVLDRFGEKDLKYEVELLNEGEAMLLFCIHAFGIPIPPQDYVNLAQDIIKYSGRLPLALVTLGSHLHGRSIEEWTDEFKRLKDIPHEDILKILKISFDGLELYTKTVFLDIACPFQYLKEKEVTSILNACGFHAKCEIATLIQKHLLQRDGHCLVMHDLVRDMGREIVHLESPQCPGGRSRLFIPEDGTEKVEVLMCKPWALKGVSTEAFQNMKNLRVLEIHGLCVSGDFGLFPKKLKWLSWEFCPLKRIPSNFPAANLVFLDLQFSAIREFDLNLQCCPMLKLLDLSDCQHLRKTPKFNGAESLETLLLHHCLSLTEIDQSICQLKSLQVLDISSCEKVQTLPSNFPPANLVFLNMRGSAIREFDLNLQCCPMLKVLNLSDCRRLRSTPKFNGAEILEILLLKDCTWLTEIDQSICQLKSLQVLDITGWRQLQTLPVDLGDVQSLRSLRASKTGIKQLPKSVEKLKNLETLELGFLNYGRSFPQIGVIESSPTSLYYGLSEADIHVDIGSLSSLISLDLSGNSFHHLPFDFSKLRFLKVLRLNDCKNLQTLPSVSNLENLETLELTNCENLQTLPSVSNLENLETLQLTNCENLETLPSISNLENLETLDLRNCKKLVDITGLDNLPSIKRIDMIGCGFLPNPFNEGFFSAHAQPFPSRNYPHKGFKIKLQCNEIPDWCSNQVATPSICLTVPRHDKEYKFLGMVLWLVCDSWRGRFVVSVSHRERESMPWSYDIGDHGELSCVYYISYLDRPFDGQMIKGGEKITVHRDDKWFSGIDIKKIGIHLLYLDQHGNVTSLPRKVDHSYSKFPEECSAGHKRAKLI